MTKYEQCKLGFYGLMSTLCLLLSGCQHAAPHSGAQADKGLPVFPDIVVHEGSTEPVQIMNVFPEHGLTDPHVMIVDDRLYIGMGHDQSWDVDRSWTMDRWEIWSTDDLRTWRKETTIEPQDTYFGPEANCWAGDFAQKDGKYYWYFSNKFYDTGVMVADKPGGPYVDALGKPLLPQGLTPVKSYDPELYEEEGVYTIIFGAGAYYAATLGDDMVSLADKPVPIQVLTSDGKKKYTDDKPAVFKRGEHYYLVWGANYAMSDRLLGPYLYQGAFMGGGHGSIFKWHGQWYVVHEHHDISMFYRGIMLKPLLFNSDGTVNLVNDQSYPVGGGRSWEFDLSRMGWRAAMGTSVSWNSDGYIEGAIDGRTIIESANWASAQTQGRTLSIAIKNQSSADQLRLGLALFKTDIPEFWSYPDIDWDTEASATLDIKANSGEFIEYQIALDSIENLPSYLKRLRIELIGAKDGEFAIDYIRIGDSMPDTH